MNARHSADPFKNLIIHAFEKEIFFFILYLTFSMVVINFLTLIIRQISDIFCLCAFDSVFPLSFLDITTIADLTNPIPSWPQEMYIL